MIKCVLKPYAILTAASKTVADDSVRSVMHNIGFIARDSQRYFSLGLRIAVDISKVADLNQSSLVHSLYIYYMATISNESFRPDFSKLG